MRSSLKKSLGFVLFCVAGFCAGYAMGLPFFQSALKVDARPATENTAPMDEQGVEFISLPPEKPNPEKRRGVAKPCL
jgi:hypothetical protein